MVVQHLSPTSKSVLVELIQRHTCLPVVLATHNVEVQAGHVYVRPPNRDLAIHEGRLRLLKPEKAPGPRSPINVFFCSLAQEKRERAIGIILSGTGSDGALGLRSIKSQGGLALAQDPATAEFDGMPRSAIATGQLDAMMAPAQMPAHLVAFVSRVLTQGPGATTDPIDDEVIQKILQRLHSKSGHDFSQYKRENLVRRLRRRMAVVRVDSARDYLHYLEHHQSEAEALFRDILIGVTRFFRDPEAFDAIRQTVIPQLFANRRPGENIRIWVPGCSTGEEAYSIAILLQEHGDELGENFHAQIFATDIDPQAIEQARSGLFSTNITADVPPRYLERFFSLVEESGSYLINRRVREMLIFSEHNVISDPPFCRVDVISFRNVLIYLEPDLHKHLLARFHYALNQGGFLFLGQAETAGEPPSHFTTRDRKERIYQRNSQSLTGLIPLPRSFPVKTLDHRPSRLASKPSNTLRDLTEHALLGEYGASAVLVNSFGEIYYLHGRTGFCLEPCPGEASMNLLKMAREGLRRPLARALRQLVTRPEKVNLGPLRVKNNGHSCDVLVTLVPLACGRAEIETPLYLVILKALEEGAQPTPEALSQRAVAGADQSPLTELQEELRQREEQLHQAYQELELAHLNLQSANEEMRSMNEELQSSNEELQTSQEELQSTNEELTTVNNELQARISDLTQANNDMNNLLAGTGVGTIFVDHKLRIVRYTPTATRFVHLIPSDIGRPVSHLASTLTGYKDLDRDIERVLDTLVARDLEIQGPQGRWIQLRIRPYRTLENIIEGVVITFDDIHETKLARDALAASHRWLCELSAALPLLVWTFDGEGACDYLSPQWVEFTGQNDPSQWSRQIKAEDTVAFEQAMQLGQTFRQTFSLLGKNGQVQQFEHRGVPLRDATGKIYRWFLTSSRTS